MEMVTLSCNTSKHLIELKIISQNQNKAKLFIEFYNLDIVLVLKHGQGMLTQ